MRNDRLISVAASAVVAFVRKGGIVYASLPDLPVIQKTYKRNCWRSVFRLADARCFRAHGVGLVAFSRKNEERTEQDQVEKTQTTREQAFKAGQLVLRLIQENKEWETLSYYDQELFLKEISKKTRITIDDPLFYNTSKTSSGCYVDVGFPINVAVTLPDARQGVIGEVVEKLELLQRSAQFDEDHNYPDCDDVDLDAF